MKRLILALLICSFSISAYSDDYVDGYLATDQELSIWNAIGTPSVSATNTGRIYYNGTSDILMASVNGGAYSGIFTSLTGLAIDGSNANTNINIGTYSLSAGTLYATDTGASEFNEDILVETMTISGGSITDSTGAISFGNENLSTTGTLGAGAITGTSFTIGANTLSTLANIISPAATAQNGYLTSTNWNTFNGKADYSFGTNNFSGTGYFKTTSGYGEFDGGILAIGGTTAYTIPSGAGVRFMWIPSKTAFRSGQVRGTQWDTANIGSISFSTGLDNIASGEGSTAIGYYNTASGVTSFAVGANSTASNNSAAAFGGGTASGSGATAFASGVASGDSSLALGFGVTASGNGSFAFGRKNVGLFKNADITASGYGSIAGGVAENLSGSTSHILSSGNGSIALGYVTASNNLSAIGDGSIAMGQNVNAIDNPNVLVFGRGLTVSTQDSFNIGFGDGITTPDFQVLAGGVKALKLLAGTDTAGTAPLKFTSGTLLTSPESGVMEFLTDKFYLTKTTSPTPTRFEVQLYNEYYGEIYIYENTTSTGIATQNVYHAIGGTGIGTAGAIAGFTATAGVNGAIASVADYSGTVAGTVKITVTAGHNLTTADIVTIAGTTDYNGTFSITKISTTEFYITETYTSSQTGIYIRGARLKADTGSAGTYRISFNITGFSAGANKTFKIEANKNLTALDNTASSRKFSTASDYSQMTGTGLVTLADGDVLWLSIVNQTDATDFTVRHLNANLDRL